MSDAQWQYPNPCVMDVNVQEKHIDALNHVNNAVYVDWCQQAGWAHSRQLGLGMDEYQQYDRAMVIRRSHFDYIKAAYLGDVIKLGTWLTASDGRFTMERCFQMIRESDGETILKARWELVCVSISDGRIRRMPELYRQAYGAALIVT